jgi:hypothetical protein
MQVQAKNLKPGDQIIQQSATGQFFRFSVEDTSSWDRDQIRVVCNNDTVTFWFDHNEILTIDRDVDAYESYLNGRDRF